MSAHHCCLGTPGRDVWTGPLAAHDTRIPCNNLHADSLLLWAPASSSPPDRPGILMWELISGKQPYHDRNLKQLPHEVVNKGLRPIFPPNTPEVYK